MIDLNDFHNRIRIINQEDRALQRCNPSAWSMPEDGQEHILKNMLLSSRSSFGLKAINLLSWCSAPTKAKHMEMCLPVGHMSVCSIRLPLLRPISLKLQVRHVYYESTCHSVVFYVHRYIESCNQKPSFYRQ